MKSCPMIRAMLEEIGNTLSDLDRLFPELRRHDPELAGFVWFQGWKENREAWEKTGSDRPYHYLGSVKCCSRIGKAFAEAVISLQK